MALGHLIFYVVRRQANRWEQHNLHEKLLIVIFTMNSSKAVVLYYVILYIVRQVLLHLWAIKYCF